MIYLDNAATSFPKPVEVYSEVLRCMENYAANPGRSSHNMAVEASSKIMDTRQELSEIFNIPNMLNIIFTCNATEALNIGKKGITFVFMVDASQSAGVIPIDVTRENIDLLAFPGHKGLCGPHGTGGLYIREGLELDCVSV